uniref:Uncharacterized protein n=1 Tax=Micrurus carvalhoi TaxID=3147026 RepID=A0A2H6NED3_9SAUR
MHQGRGKKHRRSRGVSSKFGPCILSPTPNCSNTHTHTHTHTRWLKAGKGSKWLPWCGSQGKCAIPYPHPGCPALRGKKHCILWAQKPIKTEHTCVLYAHTHTEH